MPTVAASICRQVTKTVSGELNKSWLYRYAVGGRERQMGLGSLTEVKLADAGQKAAACRQQRLDGIDPVEARESARRLAEVSGITFRCAFETYFATKRKILSSGSTAWRTLGDGRPLAFFDTVMPATPSGKIELVSKTLAERWAPRRVLSTYRPRATKLPLIGCDTEQSRLSCRRGTRGDEGRRFRRRRESLHPRCGQRSRRFRST
jgi:Arm domain-containing DNA-binding protein